MPVDRWRILLGITWTIRTTAKDYGPAKADAPIVEARRPWWERVRSKLGF